MCCGRRRRCCQNVCCETYNVILPYNPCCFPCGFSGCGSDFGGFGGDFGGFDGGFGGFDGGFGSNCGNGCGYVVCTQRCCRQRCCRRRSSCCSCCC